MPTTALATGPADLADAFDQLRQLERLFRAKDAAGFKRLVILGTDPDAAEQRDALADAAAAGQMAQVMVEPLDGRVEGDVMVIAAGFIRRPAEPRPDIESAWFVRREGRWRLILGGTNHLGIMSAEERESAATLEHWYDTWLESQGPEKVQEKLRAIRR